MKTIDKNGCRMLRERINAELAKLANELGISITAESARFTDTNATFKLEVAVKSENGDVITKEARAYTALCKVYSLPEDGLGKTISFNGSQFKITGLNTKAGKFPLLATKINDGRSYKLPLAAAGGK